MKSKSRFNILMTPLLAFLPVGVCCFAGIASASQPLAGQPASDAPKQMTINDALAAIDGTEPVRHAGLRASLMRQTQRIIPAVVVVHDAGSYFDALASWEGPIKFPILWDDGTPAARENIARFVRAFNPEHVLEYSTENPRTLGDTREQREEMMIHSIGRALSDQAPSWDEAFDELRENKLFTPGVVVTDVNDDAWAGALALAAGRIQPIVFITNPSVQKNKDLSSAQGDALEADIERAVQTLDMDWDTIGDDIDTITLASNVPTRINTGAKARDSLATSDRIGRRDANGVGNRWAYTGQIIGNTPACIYTAMCSLFLEIDNAFLWDGYANKTPWSDYDMTEASEQLALFGIDAELHDQPRYTLNHWRERMFRPVEASLIMLNSKGSQNRFDLPGGGAVSGDIPILSKPAVIHMVHSFSMKTPTDERTIGGRLLARGVYAYAGSVDEPYLSAFVPSPLIARRLGGSICFAAAVRYDDGKVWKIATLGDPLITLGTSGTRVAMPTLGDQFVDVSERVAERVKDEDFEGALADLVLLGRDRDASRLALSLMKNRPSAFTHACAQIALPAIFREGEAMGVIDAYERLSVEDRESLTMRDILWFAARIVLQDRPDLRIEAILRANFREWQLITDAEELAMFIRRRSLPDALAMLESFRNDLPSQGQRDNLDKAISRVKK